MTRKQPRWTIAFLRALERTGEVQAAAEDAGIDKSTAYARRRAHADFAEGWEQALERYRAEKKRVEEEEIAALRCGSAPPLPNPLPLEGARGKAGESPPLPNPSPAEGRGALNEEVGMSGGQVRRVSKERWGKRKEKIFFDELAATNNLHRSAAAAGVTYNAVHARRLRDPLFAAKWDAVARSARAAIDMHLIEETQKSFEPAALNLPEGPPRVTIDQAIKISQIGAAKDKNAAVPFQEEAAAMSEEEVDELRARVLRKLERLAERRKAEGWSYDEEHRQMTPPGWGKLTD